MAGDIGARFPVAATIGGLALDDDAPFRRADMACLPLGRLEPVMLKQDVLHLESLHPFSLLLASLFQPSLLPFSSFPVFLEIFLRHDGHSSAAVIR